MAMVHPEAIAATQLSAKDTVVTELELEILGPAGNRLGP